MSARRTSNKERSALVAQRVRDELGRLGGNRSRAAMLDAKTLFCKRAVRLAKERDMRLWAAISKSDEESALASLNTLLGESVHVRLGKSYTGVNEHWVLDLWEVTLDDLCHYEPTGKKVQDPGTEQLQLQTNGGGESGVQVAQDGGLSLSARLLDAYLARDDEGFMQLVVNIEKRGM